MDKDEKREKRWGQERVSLLPITVTVAGDNQLVVSAFSQSVADSLLLATSDTTNGPIMV